MRVLRFVMVMCLMLALAGICAAQMSDEMNQGMQEMRATVQKGPVVRAGLPASADVFIDGKFALRIPASAAGLSPMQRGQMVATRLNNAFAAGAMWQDMSVSPVSSYWVVMLGNMPIVTADANSARATRTSPPMLASNWARQTVVALGGQPQMIASQLTPTREMVAGAQEEVGAMPWTTARTKMVPLIGASNGTSMGTVSVGGNQTALNKVNAVVVYKTTTDQATVWTFVPVTQSAMAERYTRVPNVGLMSVPEDIFPKTGYMMGGNIQQMITQMSNRWNNMINTTLTQKNLGLTATTKIVPLYSMEDDQIAVAAQVIGQANDVARVEAVASSMRDSMVQFQASTDRPPYTAQPATLNNVLVQSVIMLPEAGMAQPGTGGAAGEKRHGWRLPDDVAARWCMYGRGVDLYREKYIYRGRD